MEGPAGAVAALALRHYELQGVTWLLRLDKYVGGNVVG